MKLLPASVQHLVTELSKLPGVGARSALRYSVHLMQSDARNILNLQRAMHQMMEEVSECPTCHFWAQNGLCPICQDSSRSGARICLVRDCPDVLAIEKGRSQPFRYHILHGLLSPLSGRGPQHLRLESLFRRLETGEVSELILALDPTVEGDATALFLKDHLRTRFPDVRLTRTAVGLPAGSSVEYMDSSTLESALNSRTTLE